MIIAYFIRISQVIHRIFYFVTLVTLLGRIVILCADCVNCGFSRHTRSSVVIYSQSTKGDDGIERVSEHTVGRRPILRRLGILLQETEVGTKKVNPS